MLSGLDAHRWIFDHGRSWLHLGLWGATLGARRGAAARGFPRPISGGFNGLTDKFNSKVDAALVSPEGNAFSGLAYFFTAPNTRATAAPATSQTRATPARSPLPGPATPPPGPEPPSPWPGQAEKCSSRTAPSTSATTSPATRSIPAIPAPSSDPSRAAVSPDQAAGRARNLSPTRQARHGVGGSGMANRGRLPRRTSAGAAPRVRASQAAAVNLIDAEGSSDRGELEGATSGGCSMAP